MSFPITAVGPLNVETKPILIVFFWAAMAGLAASNNVAPAANRTLRICSSPGTFGPLVCGCHNVPASTSKGPPARGAAKGRTLLSEVAGAMRERALTRAATDLHCKDAGQVRRSKYNSH